MWFACLFVFNNFSFSVKILYKNPQKCFVSSFCCSELDILWTPAEPTNRATGSVSFINSRSSDLRDCSSSWIQVICCESSTGSERNGLLKAISAGRLCFAAQVCYDFFFFKRWFEVRLPPLLRVCFITEHRCVRRWY